MKDLKCQCEAAKDGNCSTSMNFTVAGNLIHIVIAAPHIKKEQFGGELGIYIGKKELEAAIAVLKPNP